MARRKLDDLRIKEEALKLRREGYSYREIAKKVGCSVFKVHSLISQYESPRERIKQVVELSDSVEKLKGEFDEILRKLKEHESILKDLEELGKIKKLMESLNEKVNSLNNDFELIRSHAEWKYRNCKYCRDDGYCDKWRWRSPVPGWDMKEETRGGKKTYRLNIKKHTMYCAACHEFVMKK
ncbi:MAG: hypothetical protein RMH75_06035 [Archaeoglobaceae archaeon]|nr:hypothetical protein [Archaeoglobaceae archaeon]MDW7990204.1 hypothetical protein [Archaeoglobaceae archaeon]